MSYTTSGISILAWEVYDLGRVIRALTSHDDKVVQCYVSGRLTAWQRPVEGVVEFVLTEPTDDDLVFLLAVDESDSAEDYWEEAFGVGANNGNRIAVRTPRTIAPYEPDDRWKVFRGQADSTSADMLVWEQLFYPGGRRSGGWGKNWGYGGWGFGGYDCAGWGMNWGLGEWGFDCEMLSWTSEPLPSGQYPVRVLVEDTHGNESQAYETTVTVTTYPRPATDPAVDSYDKSSDTLTLSWTLSADDS